MNTNEWMMLTESEIAYEKLSVAELKQLALGEELFIATAALGELANRDRTAATTVATTILERSLGDAYLQAAALETLFPLNADGAIAWMNQQAGACDGCVLGAIADLIVENPAQFQSSPARAVANKLYQRLQTLPAATPSLSAETNARFLDVYRQLQAIPVA